MEQMVCNLSLRNHVTFSGWIAKEDMPKMYQSADIFVLPSLDEGMPNAVLEAMASKLPVITTNILKDDALIIDGHNGFLVPSKNVSILSEKISLLLKDTKLRTEMGQRSFQIVRSKYKWKDVSNEYYKHLISIRKNYEKEWSTKTKYISVPSNRSNL